MAEKKGFTGKLYYDFPTQKCLEVKLPNEKDKYLSLFNPDTSQSTPTMELRKVSSTFNPGYSTPPGKGAAERQKSQEFKKGVAK